MTKTETHPKKSAAILAHFLSPNDGRIEKVRAVLRSMSYTVDVLSWESQHGPYPTLAGGRLLGWSDLVMVLTVLILPLVFLRYWRADSMTTAKSASAAFLKRRAMRKALSNGRFDLVIATDPETLEPAALFAAKQTCTLIYDAHEYYPEEVPNNQPRKDWVHRTHKRASAQIDAFITVNAEIATLYQATEPWMPKADVIHNAAPARSQAIADDGRLRAAAGLGAQHKVCLFQGAFLPERGLESLVSAFDHISDSWRLVCMGSGPIEAGLRKIAGDKVVFLPPVAWLDLPFWSVGADLGAILYAPTCANQRLCSPNKLWELPAAQVPILATDLPFLGRMVQSHGIGFTLPPFASSETIANFISQLSDNDLDRSKSACLEFSKSQTWDIEAKRLKAIVLRASQTNQKSPTDLMPDLSN
jgi:glycosyltransferase involved in cell wall biosynthesis